MWLAVVVVIFVACSGCASPPPPAPAPCVLRDAGAHRGPSALEVINAAIAQALIVEQAAEDFAPDAVTLPPLPECTDDLCRMPDAGRTLETLERDQ